MLDLIANADLPSGITRESDNEFVFLRNATSGRGVSIREDAGRVSVCFVRFEGKYLTPAYGKGCRFYKTERGALRAAINWINN